MSRSDGSLDSWIRSFGAPSAAEPLAEAGVRALRASLERPGRNREGAWALLAADALVTEACAEAVAEGTDDPGERLEALLRSISGVTPP